MRRRRLLGTSLLGPSLLGASLLSAGWPARAASSAGPSGASSAASSVPAPAVSTAASSATPTGPTVHIWKSPTCGCCGDWVAHLQAHGFRTRVFDTGNEAMRERLRIPARYGSCHTAQVAGYALEGHVPAADIRRLLRERPRAIGLAVPGMPIGSPGMDGPAYGGRRDPHEVLLIRPDGSARTWRAYR